jgi:transcriptional regulator with GAF, ATPase, and Fis domain
MSAQAGGLIPVLSGVLVMALAVAGGTYVLMRRIKEPVLQLSRTAAQITATAELEVGQDITQHLQHLDKLQSTTEFADLAAAFEQMAMVFQQHLVQFNSIYAMGQAITAKVDFEQTVQAVLDAVKQVVEFDAAEVSVLRGNRLVVEAWMGQPDFNNTTGREYHVGRGPTGMIASTKAPVLVSTLSGNEEDLRRTLGYESSAGEFLMKTHKVMINSFLGIPLLIGDRLIGTLTLVHREPGRFTEDERWQLNKLAGQASIAIDNAIQVKQREDALKAQIRELKVEIDHTRIDEQVEEITTSDYFQSLQTHAAKMRNRVYTKDRRKSPEAESSSDDPGTPPAP